MVLGSTAGTTRTVVDELREQGIKVGMLKLRVFRPFPGEESRRRSGTSSAWGSWTAPNPSAPWAAPSSPRCARRSTKRTATARCNNFIYGLGGRDIFPDNIEEAYAVLRSAAAGEEIR